MNDTVLIVAAHPDDEVLGCGGAMALHAAHGDVVHVLIVAEGATARDEARDEAARSGELEQLKQAARRASSLLGCREPCFLGLPDNRLDELALLDVVKQIEARIVQIKPNLIYTHHAGDLNIDHRIVHQAVLTACRPQPETSVRAIYSFEVMSSTEWASISSLPFIPTRFVDISSTIDKKLAALRCYTSEMRDFPHARSLTSLESLARMRGASVGCEAAEAFAVVREIVK